VAYDDLWNAQWGELQEQGPVHRHITRIVLEIIRALDVKSVVDVGCGNGANLAALQRSFGLTDVVGLDISAAAIDSARKAVSGELRVRDVMAEGGIDRQFDLVLSSQVIEHIEDDEAFLQCLHEMCARYCLVGTMQGRMRSSELSIGHVRNYARGELALKMRKANFEVVKTVEWGFPFYSPAFRTAIEWFGGTGRGSSRGTLDRVLAKFLYQLYRLNSSRRGDVIMVLASRRS
jgi:SAM-dependent methyltransferase